MTSRRIVLTALLSSALALPAAGQNTVDVAKLPVNSPVFSSNSNRPPSASNGTASTCATSSMCTAGHRVSSYSPRRPNLMTGPTPYGAPTHQQMIEAVTPQEYRAPAADFGALFRWLADKSKDKK